MRALALVLALSSMTAIAGEPATLEDAERALAESLRESRELEARLAPDPALIERDLKPLRDAAGRFDCRGDTVPFVAVVAGYEWTVLQAVPFLRPLGLKPKHKYEQTGRISRVFHEDEGWANVETYSWVDGDEIEADVVKAVDSGPCRPVILLGYSYGGDTVSQVVKALDARKIQVDLHIELDTIGRSDQTLPGNVRRALCVFQEKGPLNGNAKLAGGQTPPVIVNLGPIGHDAIRDMPFALVEALVKARDAVTYPGANAFNRRR